jgi:ABC-type transport system involved in multi-copper enzyme maturation permease subunit
MNTAIVALFKDTLRKELRNKTLLLFFIFSTISVFIAYSLLKMFIQNGVTIESGQANTVVSAMFGFLNFWGVIVSVFFGVSAIRSDFQNSIIYQYLSFPISRKTYLAGRFLGTWFLVFMFYVYSYSLTIILFMSVSKSFAPNLGHFMCLLIMGIYSLIYLGLTFICSFYLNKLGAFISMFFVSALISISDSTMQNIAIKEYFIDFTPFKLIAITVYWLFPRIGSLSTLGNYFLFGGDLNLNFWIEVPHLIFSTAIFFYLGLFIIKKKDF